MQGQLDLALTVTAGASARRSDPMPVEDNCSVTDFYLTVSQANALALFASGYPWTEVARAAAQQYAVSEKRIREIRNLMLERYAAQEREWLAALQSLPTVSRPPVDREQEVSAWIDAVRQQLGLTKPPVPAHWSTIELVIHEGETLFAVTCPVCETVKPTAEREFLDMALTMTPGASAVRSEPEGYKLPPGGVGDCGELITYYLALRPANALALLAAGFSWSEEAREAAQRNPLGDEAIRVKRLLLEQYAATQREFSDAGQRLPRAFARFLSRWLDAVRQQLGLAETPA
jgi:hypothetical protein